MITVTDKAKEKIQEALTKRRRGVGIKVGVKTTGCSGMAYVLEYLDEDKFDPGEERIVYENFIITVSRQHVPYLQGMVIDYTKKGLNEGFDFVNPNERDRCGCGESFRV